VSTKKGLLFIDPGYTSAVQPKDFWKSELRELSTKSDGTRTAENGPILLDVLEGFLKYEVFFPTFYFSFLMSFIFLTVYLCLKKID
jgi:hypothetical protein